ncbi:MAG: DUF1549 domain-containing protein [Planctomycetaceae bacterium]
MPPSADADRTTCCGVCALIRPDFLRNAGSPLTFWQIVQTTPQKLIDRLLKSHFGERMATFWLDLVRYANTVGYHGDQDMQISPYRDWVIEAFNSNMPFLDTRLKQLVKATC